MTESRTNNVLKNSGASLIYKFGHIFFRFILRTAFIRLLGNEYTGIAGLFTDILSVLNLMELGLDTSMVYALFSPIANNDQKKISALLKFYKKAFTLIGCFILSAGLICIPLLRFIVKGVPNIKEDIRLIFLMYIATSASSYFLVYRTMMIRARQHSRVISIVQIVVETIETILVIVTLLVFKSYFGYLIIHLAATWIKNIYLSRQATKRYPESFQSSDEVLSPEERRKLVRDIACLTVYTLSGVVINSTDSIFISAFVGTVEVAIIGNFTLLISSVRTAIEQINHSLKPSVGNLAATSDSIKQEIVFRRINFICFWAVCFSATCLFALLNPFVGSIWLNHSYELNSQILVILIVNFFIAVMVFPVESFRTANGLFVQGWARPAIMALLNIVLDFFMGKRWGVIGIFLATTISRMLTQVWYDPFLVYRTVFKKKPWSFYGLYLQYAAVTAASCGIAYYAASLIPEMNRIVSFGLKMFVVAVIPNLLILLLYHKCEEFQYTQRFLGKTVRKVFRT